MLNVVTLIGRLTADPEVRSTTNDNKVTSFCLAVNRNYAKQGAERETDWIDCVGWNQTAELIGKHFHKGSQIAITGRLQTRTYEDRDGKKRKVTEVLVTSFNFLDKKETREETRDEPLIAADDEDIPF